MTSERLKKLINNLDQAGYAPKEAKKPEGLIRREETRGSLYFALCLLLEDAEEMGAILIEKALIEEIPGGDIEYPRLTLKARFDPARLEEYIAQLSSLAQGDARE